MDALRFVLPRLEELFDDAVFLSSLEVVFVWFHMDSEQTGTVWGEFVANIVESINGSVFPRLNGQYRPSAVYPLLDGICFARYASAFRVVNYFYCNRIQWKPQCPPYEGVGLREAFVSDDEAQGVRTGHGLGAIRRLYSVCHRLS